MNGRAQFFHYHEDYPQLANFYLSGIFVRVGAGEIFIVLKRPFLKCPKLKIDLILTNFLIRIDDLGPYLSEKYLKYFL